MHAFEEISAGNCSTLKLLRLPHLKLTILNYPILSYPI